MTGTIEQQLSAIGAAQVIAIVRPDGSAPRGAGRGRLSASVARGLTPVKTRGRSRPHPWMTVAAVAGLLGHFRTSELTQDSAVAAAMADRVVREEGLPRGDTSGLRAVRHVARAAVRSVAPAAAVRFFPNLGVLLGTVDASGLATLRADRRVEAVLGTPAIRPIRPYRIAAATLTRNTTWGLDLLEAPAVWQTGFSGKGVVVAHLDTGVDGTHPALKKAIAAFAQFDDLGFEVEPTPAAFDSDQHGTHTAATIAGRAVAGKTVGVAPDAMLVSAMVIEGGNTIARVLAGMDWAIGHGARVLSMSLGFPGYVEDFVQVTQRLRERGILPVFAVGNEGPGTSRSPGNYPEALSIGAVDRDGVVADFSSSQQFKRTRDPVVPDLVAPGVDVISAKPGGGYQSMDGTSMATPHVAGLAALLLQAKPDATVDEIEAAIDGSCRSDGIAYDRGNRGIPNAPRALEILTGGHASTPKRASKSSRK